MPPREWRLRIEDMLEAIQSIQKYILGMTLESFCSDRKTVDAVVRNFEVLGEAACHIPSDIQEKFPDIPWTRVRGMRHLLSHEYFGVSEDILWETAHQELPKLDLALKKIPTIK